jgi:hypothetical protein
MFLTDQAHSHQGHPAYDVEIREAATGGRCGSFTLVLTGDGSRVYILPDGVCLGGETPIDDVLRRVTQRPALAA